MSDSSTPQTVVIAGAGQAGGEIALQLRKRSFSGRVIVVGDEPQIPYKRPPLSKAYLAGAIGEENLYLTPRANLEKNGIEFIGGTRVARIDRAARRLELSDGRRLNYHKLALALGGRPRPLPGASGRANLFLLRSVSDVNAIRQRCAPGQRVVIVGGGFIGLEVAATLTKLGLRVTVLEGLPRVLARVTAPEVSAFFERVHREAGVDVRSGVQIRALEGEPEVSQVLLADGSRIVADFIIVGIGILPNTELAADAGLKVDDGIVVDECTRTSDPDIVAAGDCASHPNELFGRRIRLESVQNAMEQARAAAATMCGAAEPYRSLPWFWSDQYDLKLQMAGLSLGYDQLVLRGDPLTQRSFATFYLQNGVMLAADTVNRPQDHLFAKKLIQARVPLNPRQLADPDVALKSLLPQLPLAEQA